MRKLLIERFATLRTPYNQTIYISELSRSAYSNFIPCANGSAPQASSHDKFSITAGGVWWKVKKNVLVSISKGVLKYNEQWRHHKNFFKVLEMRVMKLNQILCQT